MLFQPMPLSRKAEPFNDPGWLFEIKWDGFRAVLYSDSIGVRLVSHNGNAFKSFPALCEGLARDLRGAAARSMAKLSASIHTANRNLTICCSAVLSLCSMHSTFCGTSMRFRMM